MISTQRIKAIVVSMLMGGLLWSEVALSSEQECVDLFFKNQPPSVTSSMVMNNIASKINDRKTDFDRFAYYRKFTDTDAYVSFSNPGDSAISKLHFSFEIYPPSRSVVGIKSVVGGSFNLDEESILNKISELRFIREAKIATDDFYTTLMSIKNHDPKTYSAVIEFIKGFIEWDPQGFKESNWLKGSADRNLGIQDPEMNRMAFMFSGNPMVIRGIMDMTRKILASESKLEDYSKVVYDFSKMNTAISWILTYLYYNYFADKYVSVDCSGVVLSHNILLTSAKCIYNASAIKIIKDGMEIQSIAQEVNPRYLYDSNSYRVKDTVRDFLSGSNMGIVVFPDGTFSDIQPVIVSLREPQEQEELVSASYGLTDGISKIALVKDGKSTSEIYIVEDPTPEEMRIKYGDIGGALFDKDNKLVGSISALIWMEHEDTVYNLYSLTSSESNREYLLDVVKRYPEINIEE